MRSQLIKEILKRTPLETRIAVSVRAHFMQIHGGSPLMPVDEESKNHKELSKRNAKAYEDAQPIIDVVLEKVAQWVEDGMPK
jgi:hypothetical protein